MTEPLGKVDQDVVKLRLTRGQDFQQIITPPEGEVFPAGTTARIDFFSEPAKGAVLTSWPAVVTAGEAKWRQESEVADLIADRTSYYLYFSFPDSPRVDYCRFYGKVERKQPR
ncbi:hypothetical protein HQO42_15130 [Rhodococcus fascians]|nr:hypothetical protein [Rhodococcus fascians]MBY4237788.1 hypothetical protein [Rhodococcus fascians]MBY4253991.1 hypothetical protein [Rhodococcus fascians]MBY4269138.1 hypothetical protein [Rhodococcus fascians]